MPATLWELDARRADVPAQAFLDRSYVPVLASATARPLAVRSRLGPT